MNHTLYWLSQWISSNLPVGEVSRAFNYKMQSFTKTQWDITVITQWNHIELPTICPPTKTLDLWACFSHSPALPLGENSQHLPGCFQTWSRISHTLGSDSIPGAGCGSLAIRNRFWPSSPKLQARGLNRCFQPSVKSNFLLLGQAPCYCLQRSSMVERPSPALSSTLAQPLKGFLTPLNLSFFCWSQCLTHWATVGVRRDSVS